GDQYYCHQDLVERSVAGRQPPPLRLPSAHRPDHPRPPRQPLPLLPPQTLAAAQSHRRNHRWDSAGPFRPRPQQDVLAQCLPRVERAHPRDRGEHRPPILPLLGRARARPPLYPPQRPSRLLHRRRRHLAPLRLRRRCSLRPPPCGFRRRRGRVWRLPRLHGCCALHHGFPRPRAHPRRAQAAQHPARGDRHGGRGLQRPRRVGPPRSSRRHLGQQRQREPPESGGVNLGPPHRPRVRVRTDGGSEARDGVGGEKGRERRRGERGMGRPHSRRSSRVRILHGLHRHPLHLRGVHLRPHGAEGGRLRRLTERIEDFVSVLLLPLYFASSGLKTNVASIKDATSWGILALVICTACVGKIVGTFVAAIACRMAAREAITLGVLMNTKGLVELIVLNIGRERKVLNDEVFAIMVLMALFTTFITTPSVMAIYKPARAGRYTHEHRKLHRSASSSVPDPKELRVLACVHGPRDAPSLISLLDTIRGGATNRCPLKLHVLNLVELTDRPSSIVMARRSGLPFRLRREARDQVALAFDAYGQLSRVHVRSMIAVSSMAAMHEDVRDVAEQKRVSLLIVPFHRHQHRRDGAVENAGPGWRAVNRRVMREAPCSVAVLVDRGLGGGGQVRSADVAREICVIFFGGPDDREALALAGRMAQHPGVRVTAVRFVPEEKGDVERPNVTLRASPLKNADESYTFSTAVMDRQREKEMDEAAVAAFQKKTERGTARYEKRPAGNVIEAVLKIGKSGEFELVVVGKGRFPTSMVAEIAEQPAEHPELGPIGDVLASSSHGIASSVLVIQQHDMIHSEETPVSVVVDGDSAKWIRPDIHETP
ncbi:unnamed protein product, partial [Musa textilis]